MNRVWPARPSRKEERSMQGNPEYRLRQPEPTDIEALYQYRNDPWIVSELGCFSGGFARADVAEWIDSQRRSKDDFVWVIANLEDHCIGHCGLYHINSRNGSAELDLCIGDAGSRNQGIGETIGRTLLRYSFAQLNLHRLRAQAMKSNAVAARYCISSVFRGKLACVRSHSATDNFRIGMCSGFCSGNGKV
jgi:RimJ/RimL family protein N-acetyltransferase